MDSQRNGRKKETTYVQLDKPYTILFYKNYKE